MRPKPTRLSLLPFSCWLPQLIFEGTVISQWISSKSSQPLKNANRCDSATFSASQLAECMPGKGGSL